MSIDPIDPFLIRLLIAVLVYYFFGIVIGKFGKDSAAQEMFSLILLIACILYLLFGSFLPF